MAFLPRFMLFRPHIRDFHQIMTDSKPFSIPTPSSDPLAEVLHSLRMSSSFYCRSEFSAPWGLDLPEMPGHLMFHIMTRGSCFLHVQDDRIQLNAGDFVLVPHGRGHILLSDESTSPTPLFETKRISITEHYETLSLGQGGEAATMICGAVRFEHPVARRIIEVLPKMIHLQTTLGENESIQNTIRLIISEASKLSLGGDALITRLSDILVIQVVRSWLERDPKAREGWFGALHDPQIGKAISSVHRDPTYLWSLETLAESVGMSRSAFAARFMSLVGESPMQYVRHWRMRVAIERLKAGNDTIAMIAEDFGYESEAAFSRAFKKSIGTSPGTFRRKPNK